MKTSGLKFFLLATVLISGLSVSAQHYMRDRPGPPPGGNVGRRPPSPGRDAVWVQEEWKWQGGRYAWGGGYWARPPFRGAVWVPGRWVRSRFGWQWVAGQWRRRR